MRFLDWFDWLLDWLIDWCLGGLSFACRQAAYDHMIKVGTYAPQVKTLFAIKKVSWKKFLSSTLFSLMFFKCIFAILKEIFKSSFKVILQKHVIRIIIKIKIKFD